MKFPFTDKANSLADMISALTNALSQAPAGKTSTIDWKGDASRVTEMMIGSLAKRVQAVFPDFKAHLDLPNKQLTITMPEKADVNAIGDAMKKVPPRTKVTNPASKHHKHRHGHVKHHAAKATPAVNADSAAAGSKPVHLKQVFKSLAGAQKRAAFESAHSKTHKFRPVRYDEKGEKDLSAEPFDKNKTYAYRLAKHKREDTASVDTALLRDRYHTPKKMMRMAHYVNGKKQFAAINPGDKLYDRSDVHRVSTERTVGHHDKDGKHIGNYHTSAKVWNQVMNRSHYKEDVVPQKFTSVPPLKKGDLANSNHGDTVYMHEHGAKPIRIKSKTGHNFTVHPGDKLIHVKQKTGGMHLVKHEMHSGEWQFRDMHPNSWSKLKGKLKAHPSKAGMVDEPSRSSRPGAIDGAKSRDTARAPMEQNYKFTHNKPLKLISRGENGQHKESSVHNGDSLKINPHPHLGGVYQVHHQHANGTTTHNVGHKTVQRIHEHMKSHGDMAAIDKEINKCEVYKHTGEKPIKVRTKKPKEYDQFDMHPGDTIQKHRIGDSTGDIYVKHHHPGRYLQNGQPTPEEHGGRDSTIAAIHPRTWRRLKSKLQLHAWNKEPRKDTAALKLIGKHEKGNRLAKVYRDAEWEEYRVKHFVNGKHQSKADYHGNDKEDAHNSAKHWVDKASLDIAAGRRNWYLFTDHKDHKKARDALDKAWEHAKTLPTAGAARAHMKRVQSRYGHVGASDSEPDSVREDLIRKHFRKHKDKASENSPEMYDHVYSHDKPLRIRSRAHSKDVEKNPRSSTIRKGDKVSITKDGPSSNYVVHHYRDNVNPHKEGDLKNLKMRHFVSGKTAAKIANHIRHGKQDMAASVSHKRKPTVFLVPELAKHPVEPKVRTDSASAAEKHVYNSRTAVLKSHRKDGFGLRVPIISRLKKGHTLHFVPQKDGKHTLVFHQHGGGSHPNGVRPDGKVEGTAHHVTNRTADRLRARSKPVDSASMQGVERYTYTHEKPVNIRLRGKDHQQVRMEKGDRVSRSGHTVYHSASKDGHKHIRELNMSDNGWSKLHPRLSKRVINNDKASQLELRMVRKLIDAAKARQEDIAWVKKSPGHVDEHAAGELYQHAKNGHRVADGYNYTVHSLGKHHKSGKYDPEKAKKSWMHHVEHAAQDYHQHEHMGGKWHDAFPKHLREHVASKLEKEHREEYGLGNYSDAAGEVEHKAREDHTKNPYHNILTKHGFTHESTHHRKNNLAKGRADVDKWDYTEHNYRHPEGHRVMVWQHHTTTRNDKPNVWTHYHKQSNGITAPSQGDSKPQLEKNLTRHYGAKDTARVFGKDRYYWHTFKGAKPKIFKFRLGDTKKEYRLSHGDVYGVRPATSGEAAKKEHVRVVIRKHGLNRVFTIPKTQAFGLVARSERAKPGRVTKRGTARKTTKTATKKHTAKKAA